MDASADEPSTKVLPDEAGHYTTDQKPFYRPPFCQECGDLTRVDWVMVEAGRWAPWAFICPSSDTHSA